ncbi:hypothetical protein [Bacillus suaedae]|uniref:Uncharacterized protein n=1 Tax=Halalkalibacter suaedae TaxID=2822140 RepID=A0A941ATI0_9BACI|nr:hypothetical protein [Bacillus suaedae]MBP3951854.1 hypothetical protein [Bacillus suaedae]
MEFKLGDFAIVLPPLPITVAIIIIIYLLVRWGKELETGRHKLLFYFLISAFVTPIYSHSTQEGVFELWVPLGFIIIFFYLARGKSNHPAKMKASLLGLCLAIYQIILQYMG